MPLIISSHLLLWFLYLQVAQTTHVTVQKCDGLQQSRIGQTGDRANGKFSAGRWAAENFVEIVGPWACWGRRPLSYIKCYVRLKLGSQSAPGLQTTNNNSISASHSGTEDILVIPPNLQMPYSSSVREKLEEKFGGKLFQFSLVNPNEMLSPSPSCLSPKDWTQELVLSFSKDYAEEIKPEFRSSTVCLYARTEHYFTAFGRLKTNATYISPANYCVDTISEDSLTIKICGGNSSIRKSIPKCCPMGMIYSKGVLNLNDQEKGGCKLQSSGLDWTPTVHKSQVDNENMLLVNVTGSQMIDRMDIEYVGQHLQCSPYVSVSNSVADNPAVQDVSYKQIKIYDDGQVQTRTSGNHASEKLGELGAYCVDHFVDLSQVGNDELVSDWDEGSYVVWLCPHDEMQEMEVDQRKLYSMIYFYALLCSSLVLFLIFVLYALTWSAQNIHGRTIALFVLTNGVKQLMTAIAHAFGLWNWIFLAGTWMCVGVGVLAHFFNIATFSWMTVLNFDLWSTLKSMRPIALHGMENADGYKLAFYALAAFSVPTIAVSISLILETQFGFFDDRVNRPQYGRERCYVATSAELSHIISVDIVLYALSCIFIFLTLKTMWRKMSETNKINLRSTKQEQSRLLLLGKLLIVMGITWIFDIVSFLVIQDEIMWYWSIFDLYNMSQSLLLFWIFVWTNEDVSRPIRSSPLFQNVEKLVRGIKARRTVTTDGRPTNPYIE